MRAAALTLEAEPTSVPPAVSAPTGTRYWAFLSYSHRDKYSADRLHKSLEKFSIPKDLVGRQTPLGPVPPRLHPVFRDRHELAASTDLGEVIRDALGDSRSLLVLCSPAAAGSRWVDEEIRSFRRLRPDAPVLAAIVAGEPGSDGPDACFPPALRAAEPVAADFRPQGDGWRLGRLKLAAGLIGVSLDALVRRDAQRRQRRLTWIAAASLAGMGVTSGLAIAAVQARDEADRQRGEAESLVGFMLGDLRGRLEPLGRLDVLDAVGARALAYYAGQDKGVLTDDGLAQRSRALTLIGEIANLRGDLPAALRRYREALAGTGEALSRVPGDPRRIFDHAQNVFWVGYIAWQRGETQEAEARFGEYKRLADRLVAIDPGKPAWRLERVYANTNLGQLLIERGDFTRAAAAFGGAVQEAERLVAAEPGNRTYADGLGETLAYLADAQRHGGELDAALAQRERQLRHLDAMVRRFGAGADTSRRLMGAYRAIGALYLDRGDLTHSLENYQRAAALARDLQRIEPANTEWADATAGLLADYTRALLASDRLAEADMMMRESCAKARSLVDRDSSVVRWRTHGLSTCLELRAASALAHGRSAQAAAYAGEGLRLLHGRARRDLPSIAPLLIVFGDALQAQGDRETARRRWGEGLRVLQSRQTPTDRLHRSQLLARLGQSAAMNAEVELLGAIGFAHPSLTTPDTNTQPRR